MTHKTKFFIFLSLRTNLFFWGGGSVTNMVVPRVTMVVGCMHDHAVVTVDHVTVDHGRPYRCY